MARPALAPYLLRLIQSGLNRFWKCLSRVAKVPNGFENRCRGLRKWVLKLKQGFAGVQKGVLKLKQGFAGCENAFRDDTVINKTFHGLG